MASKHSNTGRFVHLNCSLYAGCAFPPYNRIGVDFNRPHSVTTIGSPQARFHFLVAFMLMIACCQGNPEQTNSPPPARRAGWTLTWNDEFSAANGSAPDPAKWVVETGGDGWGNEELEYYTARPQTFARRTEIW